MPTESKTAEIVAVLQKAIIDFGNLLAEAEARASALEAERDELEATERAAIAGLIELARAAWSLADNTADEGGEYLLTCRPDFDDLSDALDALDDLPDDQPGYTMEAGAKAEWALRRFLTPTASAAEQGGAALPILDKAGE